MSLPTSTYFFSLKKICCTYHSRIGRKIVKKDGSLSFIYVPMGSIGKFLTCLCECRDFIWCALMKHFLEGSRYTLFIDCFGMLTQRRIFVTLLILTNVPISQRSNFFEEIFQYLPSRKFKLDPWKDYWNIYSCKIIFFSRSD